MPKFKDLTGQQFGRLTVLSFSGMNKHGCSTWLCECSCEKHIQKIVSGQNLTHGYVKSCGCLKENCRTSNLKHGISRSRIKTIYSHMKDRCLNPNSNAYKDYGGRGITVCAEWLSEDGLIRFYEWAMTHDYTDNLTLDRIDVNGNYEPSNCRWITNSAQQLNRRNNHYVEIDGIRKTVKEWCDIFGISNHTFYYRVRKLGMSEIDALQKPKTSGGIHGKRVLGK